MDSAKEKPNDSALPQVAMNVNVPPTDPNAQLVKPEQIIGMCKAIADDLESEKQEITDAYVNFSEMVFNAGDATSASKEALVNLLKLRSDLVDKKARLAEMMMKVFLKDGVKTVTAHQHNDFHIGDKKALLQELNSMDKAEKDKAEKENK